MNALSHLRDMLQANEASNRVKDSITIRKDHQNDQDRANNLITEPLKTLGGRQTVQSAKLKHAKLSKLQESNGHLKALRRDRTSQRP